MHDNLATLLDDYRRHGRETAVVRYKGVRRRATTYGEIATLAGRFAALLERRGIVTGDRVLIWGENSAEWIAAFHGCLLRGVLAVPLDAYGSVEFAGRVCADVKPRLAVGDAALLRQLMCVSALLPFEDWPGTLPAEEAGPIAGLNRETPLQILFTSGTTGEPKGIVHTHGNVMATIAPIENASRRYLKYERLIHPLRILHTLPLSHVFGQMMGLWVPPIFAAELHFEHRLVAPRLIETIRRERISVLAAVPRVLALIKAHLESTIPGLEERIAAAGKIGSAAKWWHFRDVHREFGLKFWALISGGGALPGPLEQFWNALGFVLVQGYGMTETTALITLNHPFHVAQGSIGKPLAGREVKLSDDGEVLVRGASISGATWSHGELKKRSDEWLATGDLAEREPGGELRFVGRKSEVIVTASGLNIHPEDLETVVERQPGVAACAVVALETAQGIEPCAVLAMRASSAGAASAIEHANASLADFQRIRRWMVWPDPDLPRTSTGKVKRKDVAEWVGRQYARNGAAHTNGSAQHSDWLLGLIARITGEEAAANADELRLNEDLHLDSLGRVQLNAAIEERLGTAPEDSVLDQMQTLGELRRLLGGARTESQVEVDRETDAALVGVMTATAIAAEEAPRQTAFNGNGHRNGSNGWHSHPSASRNSGNGTGGYTAHAQNDNYMSMPPIPQAEPARRKYIYPHWPWYWPIRWIRNAFIELAMRPLVWLLSNPQVIGAEKLASAEPMLIVANHVSTFDGPMVQYALPGRLRRRIAAAMSGDMLEDYRHFRNAELDGKGGFFLPGPFFYWLLTALFNVFPLPKQRDFHRSFEHAGEALDRGLNVLVFPEGTRSAAGKLARFRPGIGLLVKQADAAVLPVAISGLGELKARQRGWFRSGTVEIRVGNPIRFAPDETEAAITDRLHAEVERLLNG